MLVLKDKVQQRLCKKEKCDTGKDGKRHKRALAAMMIDLGYQIARRNVQRHAAGDRQRISNCKPESVPDQVENKYAEEGHQSDERRRYYHLPKSLTGRHNHRTDSKPLGELVQKDSDKYKQPHLKIDLRSRRDRHPVKKCMDQ